jgi:hypothetical protein
MEIVRVGDLCFYTQGRLRELLKLDRERRYDLDFCRYLKPQIFHVFSYDFYF